jgi:hypothetical protein
MAVVSGKRGKSKTLRPPFVWNGRELVENVQAKRWGRAQLRAMKNGTYDWNAHQDKAAA